MTDLRIDQFFLSERVGWSIGSLSFFHVDCQFSIFGIFPVAKLQTLVALSHAYDIPLPNLGRSPFSYPTKMAEKVLCIQLKRLGDVLLTTPSVRALHQHRPDMEIHYLTQVPAHQIFLCNPYISKTIAISARPKWKEIVALLCQLRKGSYTVAIDFMGSPSTALIGLLTGVRKRIGFKRRGRNMLYSYSVEKPQGVDYSAREKLHLLTALGVVSDNTELDFYITDRDRVSASNILKRLGVTHKRPLVSVSPISRRAYKVWPAKYFAEICDYMIDAYNAQVLFLWGPGEYRFIRKVKESMRHSSLPDYDIPSIAETVGLLELVDLHVGNDNGPMHFAVAAGSPTVAIFGKPQLKNWTPPNNSRHLAVEFDPGCKESCFYPKCDLECLKRLQPEAVKEAIAAQMGETGPI